jgi:molecular chaperone DnaJ
VRRAVQSIFGHMINVTTCPRCGGEGRIIDSPCAHCHGRGIVDTNKTIEVDIPAGVDEDISVRVTGEGEAGPRGGPPGDLYISFRVQPHPQLTRHGQDLVYELPVTVPQAVLGDRITVPTVNGPHEIDVPPGTQHGKLIKINGFGVPHIRSGRRGDQLCVVHVVIPTDLSSEERDLYNRLGGRHGKPAEIKRGFFDHIKDAFRA